MDANDERASDLAQIAIFNHCKECTKANDSCEPLRVELNGIKDRVVVIEDTLRDIRNDLKGALIWAIGILLTIIGTGIYLFAEQWIAKKFGG